MTNEENRHGSNPARQVAREIRVIATYQRDEQTALIKTEFFDEATSLQDLLRWARKAEDMDIALAGLEIEVMGSSSQQSS
ncbi:MAG: hypothetical protein ACR2RF_12765 [Geminicoccaceae bacterium]